MSVTAPAPASRSLRADTVANLVGRGWSALMGFAFVPVYVKLLGVEAYGLVGLATTLQVIFALLDVGLATTLNRELARWLARPATGTHEDRPGDLVRTLEAFYWVAALVVVLGTWLLAPLIATHWLHPRELTPETVTRAIRLIGVAIALQFPFTLYEGGLLGMRRQLSLNAVIVANATLRFAGVVGVLLWVSTTLEAFFAWQAVVALLQTLAAAALLWRALPERRAAARFDRVQLVERWRFAAGMAGIGVTAVILTQMDKVVLSRLLELSALGYYMLASVVAGALYVLFLPVFQAVFPRLSTLVAAGDAPGTAALYHRGTQAVALLVLPAAAVLAVFAHEVMLLWTRDAAVPAATRAVLAVLVAGTALNGLMNVPYALQLAHGWTAYAIYQNMIAILLMVPMTALLAMRFGAVGAAAAWLALNAGYITIGVTITHRRLMPGHNARWYLDAAAPLLAALAVCAAARLMSGSPGALTRPAMLALLAVTMLAAYLAAALASPVGRSLLVRRAVSA